MTELDHWIDTSSVYVFPDGSRVAIDEIWIDEDVNVRLNIVEYHPALEGQNETGVSLDDLVEHIESGRLTREEEYEEPEV